MINQQYYQQNNLIERRTIRIVIVKAKDTKEAFWYHGSPPLEILERASGQEHRIIDVGGGASTLLIFFS